MSETHRKMIVVAYFSPQCFTKKFNHLHIILSGRKKYRHSNLIIQADFTNEEMQVFSETSLLKKLNGYSNKRKVMKFREKNIHFIDLSQNQQIDFPHVEELEIFFPTRTGDFNVDRDEVLEHLERIFQRGL